MSLREKVLKLSGRRYRTVTIPGFGDLRVRSLNERERARVEDAAKDKGSIKRVILIESLCELDSDAPVFTAADLEALGEVDGAVVDKIVSESMKLNELSEEDVRALLGEPVAS